jgi:hypothetical protein
MKVLSTVVNLFSIILANCAGRSERRIVAIQASSCHGATGL